MKSAEELRNSTVHKRIDRVVELRKESRRLNDAERKARKEAQADRLLARLVQRKCRQASEEIDGLLDEYNAGSASAESLRTTSAQLADYILHHELYDRTPYKIANTEYPFMNERMFNERAAKDTGEVQIDIQAEARTTGRRRMRSRYENALLDRRVRARNRERRKKYREFTKEQPVRTYSLP